jgi:hypothetical protein
MVSVFKNAVTSIKHFKNPLNGRISVPHLVVKRTQ